MYKVSVYRFKMRWFSNGGDQSEELEKHINEIAKIGWDLISAYPMGVFTTLIWKKRS
jgi:hypothetical protein